MKKLIGCILGLIIIVNIYGFSHAFASQSDDQLWITLTDLSNQIFLYTQDGRPSEAESTMNQFDSVWNKALDNGQINLKKGRVVETTFEQVKETFTNSFDDKDALTDAVTEFRLAVDALAHPYDPMWKHMDKKVLNQFAKIKMAATSGDAERYQSQLNIFLDDYKVIYPALVIDLGQNELTKIDGDVNSLSVPSMKGVNSMQHLQLLNQAHTDFKRLFGSSIHIYVPNLLWAALFLGVFILFTLIYVLWKKYNGDYRITSYKYFPK